MTHAWARRDHPRSRGEKVARKSDVDRPMGSPPLTRGKEIGMQGIQQSRGITPAHAGKRTARTTPRPASGDHPRSRGEKRKSDRLTTTTWESPPLTRGKGPSAQYALRMEGITPAHAGKSYFHYRTMALNTESPPLTRGKEIGKVGVFRDHGITPAHAGKRLKDP